MNIWLKQHTNIHAVPEGWRACVATVVGSRVFINDKIDNHQLISCSLSFFESEIVKGRIVCERL